MADREHPKTHVEDQDLDGLRKQPLSPKHEGIDPLTESDTMLPREDVKGASEKLAKKETAQEPDTEQEDKTAQTVEDQNEVNAKANTPNDLLPENEEVKSDDNERGAADPGSSEPADVKTPEDVKADRPAETETPKSKTTGSKTSSR